MFCTFQLNVDATQQPRQLQDSDLTAPANIIVPSFLEESGTDLVDLIQPYEKLGINSIQFQSDLEPQPMPVRVIVESNYEYFELDDTQRVQAQSDCDYPQLQQCDIQLHSTRKILPRFDQLQISY
jgi:hypothetical protein